MTYYPGSAEALTLSEAAEQIAYCFQCQACRSKERVNLTRLAADFPAETRVGDLLDKLPCGQCGSTKKIVMTLWLSATTTNQMLVERGYPIWDED
jgi:hypothetical protein